VREDGDGGKEQEDKEREERERAEKEWEEKEREWEREIGSTVSIQTLPLHIFDIG